MALQPRGVCFYYHRARVLTSSCRCMIVRCNYKQRLADSLTYQSAMWSGNTELLLCASVRSLLNLCTVLLEMKVGDWTYKILWSSCNCQLIVLIDVFAITFPTGHHLAAPSHLKTLSLCQPGYRTKASLPINEADETFRYSRALS